MNLRDFTMARVGLERAGDSLATREVLAFQMAHAKARDAVWAELDVMSLRADVGQLVALRSAAGSRAVYLKRPDLGRRLDEASRKRLVAGGSKCDLSIVICDGLSALAVQRQAPAVVEALKAELEGWSVAPLMLVEQGRVAVGDEIGEAVGADLVLVLIGERPGLTSPDSLGAYLTWNPRPGRTDAERNCISNIRPEGLPAGEAARRIAWLARQARSRQLTGVALKEDGGIGGHAPEAIAE